MEYTDAMRVLGPLYENGWPELKEHMGNEEVRIALRAYVEACLDLSKAYERDIECRMRKGLIEKAVEEMNLTHDELMNLIE
jgi:hypothetical protein